MAKVPLSVEEMRQCLADFSAVSDNVLEIFISQAKIHVSDEDYGLLNGRDRAYAIYLAAAHLYCVGNPRTAIGRSAFTGRVSGASVGGVSVSYTQPPTGRFETWFWNQTKYGSQLVVLLKSCSGPMLYGGSIEQVLP